MSRTKDIPARDLVPMVSVLATPSGHADQLVTDVWKLRSEPGVVYFTTVSGEHRMPADAPIRVVA
jgi:hypothetical protein